MNTTLSDASETGFQIEIVSGPRWEVAYVPGCGTGAFDTLTLALLATLDVGAIVSDDALWRIRDLATGEIVDGSAWR